MSKPPTLPASRKPPKLPTTAKKETKKPVKIFQAKAFDDDTDGEKVILYGPSGMGKTTLGSLAPKPIFFSLDDGARKMTHPITGERLIHVPGVDSFADMREALHQNSVFDPYDSIIVDTGTELEAWATQYVLDNYSIKNAKASNIQAYGFGNGYSHLCDVMRFIQQDLQLQLRRGKNIVILCQLSSINKSNPGGEDYIKDGPAFYHDKRYSVRELMISWADHVAKIDYGEIIVADKKIKGSIARHVFVRPEPHFEAKSRTLPIDLERIAFDSPQDDSFWQILLGEK